MNTQLKTLMHNFIYSGKEGRTKAKVKWTTITLLTSEGGLEVIDPTTQANTLFACLFINDTPLNSLRDPNVGSRMKQRKKKNIGAHFLTHTTPRVGERVGAPGWD
jgi:hypothetical protein